MKSKPSQMLSTERKKIVISLIQQYFESEREEQLGDLATELFYEFIERELAPYFFNQAIDDVRQWFTQRLPYLEADLELLKKDTKVMDEGL